MMAEALPPIGLGTWPLTGDEATAIVCSGIEAGYRLIDTAAVYENEEAVGRGVRESGAVGEAPYVNQIQLDPTLARTAVRQADDALGVQTQSWSPLGRGEALSVPVVGEIARRHGVTTAQVVLAWHRAHELTPIVRSSRPERLTENLAALEVHLSAEEVDRLDRLDRGEGAARDVETEEAIS